MYELLLRTETLLAGLQASVLWGIGIGGIVVGLILWLGGTRYHAAIIGLLGAVVGAAAGLLVSQRFNVDPWLSIVVGAIVLGGLSILLRNILILVLAVLVFSAVGGTGYLAVTLDRAGPQAQAAPQPEQRQSVRYFSGMNRADRLNYMDDITRDSGTFTERLKALLANTWQALGPHAWWIVFAVLAGAFVGILLVWLIAKIVIALAYSIVGTATLFLGAQATLLAAGIPLVSELDSRRWLLPVTFAVLIVVGWVWQLFYAGARKPRKEPPEDTHASD